jgi:hypothetical protein
MSTEVVKELTFKEFSNLVFAQAMAIVAQSNCDKYKIMGRKYLDVRLILYFHDCNQVFDFTKGETELEYTSFFTKDKVHEEEMEELKKWKEEEERDKPEEVKA